MTPSDEKLLNDLFEDVKQETVEPSDALMARVLADAAQLQPVKASAIVEAPSLWSRAITSIGGWGAMSGVAAAGVAGLWIGLTPPDSVDSWVAEAMGSTTSISFVDEFAVFEEGSFDG